MIVSSRLNPLFRAVVVLCLTFSAISLAAQGFEIGAMAVHLPKKDGGEYRGPGLQAAVDLWGSSRRGVQLRSAYQRQTFETAQADLASFGLQGYLWSDGVEGHAILGLEARSERISSGHLGTTYGRIWARCGLGFQGILVPLWPFPTYFIARGNDRIVPFTRFEYALPLTTRRAPGFVLPSSEVSLQVGVRFNLD